MIMNDGHIINLLWGGLEIQDNGEKNNNALSFRLQLLNLFYRYQLLD